MKENYKSISPYVFPGVKLTGQEKEGLMKNPNRYKMTTEQILEIIS